MGPKISKTGNRGASEVHTQKAHAYGTNQNFLDNSSFMPGSHDASMAQSFIKGHSPDVAQNIGGSQAHIEIPRLSLKKGVSTQPGWNQLSRQQQRIYQQWRRAHKNQLHFKMLKQKEEERARAHVSTPANSATTAKDARGRGTMSQEMAFSPDSDQQQQQNEQGGATFSLWQGLQKRLNFAGFTGGQDKELEEEPRDAIEVALTIQVSESESIRVPLDLTEHASLTTFTSQWLKDQIFKVVREKKLATRSASHSKSSTDVPGSEDGLSQQRQHYQMLAQLEPVCLSTVYNEAECIDFLLTQKHQLVATFLPMQSVLKVNYVAKDEIEEEKEKQVPSLRNFDFIKVLGTGGFATVYMVRKRTTGMLYAMKLVKKDGVKQDEVKFAQVYTERQILERLRNPFLVQLHYAFVTKNYYCLVIDLCTGGELFYYLQKHQSFSLGNAKQLFAEVLLAVEFLHSHDIMYRDLKPENILVDERGHLRLTDFGLCRGDFKQGRDRAMSFVGSPEYMSPEILLGQGYNYSVDYYTLGVLLYEMLVGLPPHYNEDKMQMYKDITMKEPSIPNVLPADARDILARLLQIDPTNRLGMGLGGIQEIKNHAFFSDIDWRRLSQKEPQPGRKRLPIEVNLLDSNFDKQYTRLPIKIDVAQEELIKINEPIQLTKKLLIRSKSFTARPVTRTRAHAKKAALLLKRQSLKLQRALRRDFTILSGEPNKGDSSMKKHKSMMARRKVCKQGSIPEPSTDQLVLADPRSLQNMPVTANQSQLYDHADELNPMMFSSAGTGNMLEKSDPLGASGQGIERTLQRQTQSNQLMMLSTSTMQAMVQNNNHPNHQHSLHLDRNRLLQQQYSHQLKKVTSGGTNMPKQMFMSQDQQPFFNGMSTVEKQSSVQISQADFRGSQSVLDDMTEISVANEKEDSQMRKLKRQKQAMLVLQRQDLMHDPHGGDETQNSKGTPYLEALSPFGSPDDDGTGGAKTMKHHGFSEYTKRPDAQGKNISSSRNQESAFNYRKQTLYEDEVSVIEQPSSQDIDNNQNKDQWRDKMLLTASQNDAERTVWNMQNTSTTPNKHVQNMATPSMVGSEKMMTSDRVPKNSTAKTNVNSYMVNKLSPYQLTPWSKPGLQTTSARREEDLRTLEERLAEEIVLEEEVGSYKAARILPENPANKNKRGGSTFVHEIAPQSQLVAGSTIKRSQQISPTELTRVTGQITEAVQSAAFSTCELGVTQSPPLNKSQNSRGSPRIKIEISPSMSEAQEKVEYQSFNAYASFAGNLVLQQKVQEETLAKLAVARQANANSVQSSSFLTESSDSNEAGHQEGSDNEVSEYFASDQGLQIEVEDDLRSNTQVTQIDQGKIDTLKKRMSKKLKKRLSEENLKNQGAVLRGSKKTNQIEQEHDELQYQYGFSVEQQKAKVQVVKFNQSAVLRNVARHQSSHNISNLIAQSVMRHTPKVFSKQASQEKLLNAPLADLPPVQAKVSSLQHSQLIIFTEKAAGVVSERNRKFQKPQTLKNLEQKMLQPEENEMDFMFTEESNVVKTSEGPSQVELVQFNVAPLMGLRADEQLNFNSEMISINEFESEVEQEGPGVVEVDSAPVENGKLKAPEQDDAVDSEVKDTPATNEDFDVSSEEVRIDASPVLQFQSQSMADINSPFNRPEQSSIESRTAEEKQAFVIRESISSPNIMSNKQKDCFELSRNGVGNERTNQGQCVQLSSKQITLSGLADHNWLSRQSSPHWKAVLYQKQPADFAYSSSKMSKTLKPSITMPKQTNKRKLGSPASKYALSKASQQQRDSCQALTSRDVDSQGKATKNTTSLIFPDFQTSSKKMSMVLPLSPYEIGASKKRQQNILNRGPPSRVSNKGVANQTTTGIDRSSGIGNMLMKGSYSKKNKDAPKGFSTGQKTKKHQQNASNTSLSRLGSNLNSNQKTKQKLQQTKTLSAAGTGLASANNASSRKGPSHQLQLPPKQPTLLNSPMQKTLSGDYIPPTSLRVYQTPCSQPAQQNNQNRPDPVTPKNAGPYSQTTRNAISSTQRAETGKHTREKNIIMLEKVASSAKRLAKANSHQSFHSQGQNSALQSRNQVGDAPKYATFAAIQIDKEAYTRWKEGPVPAPLDRHQTFAPAKSRLNDLSGQEKNKSRRSSSESPHLDRSETEDKQNIVRAFTQPQTDKMSKKRISDVKQDEAKRSIFEVVDDIMSSLVLTSNNKDSVAPYGISKSPEVNKKKKANNAIFESINFIKEIRKTNSNMLRTGAPQSVSEQKVKPKKESKKTQLHNLLQPNQSSQLSQMQMMRTLSAASDKKPPTLIRAELAGHQPSKQDFTKQLVPIEPSDSGHMMPTFLDEDDTTDLRPQPLCPPTDQSLVNSPPPHASTPVSLRLNRTPFKYRLMKVTTPKRHNLLNETSVEVLKLDASEFNMSDRELTRSNLLTLRSEECFSGGGPPEKNSKASLPKEAKQKLNATFQGAGGVSSNPIERNCGVLSAGGQGNVQSDTLELQDHINEHQVARQQSLQQQPDSDLLTFENDNGTVACETNPRRGSAHIPELRKNYYGLLLAEDSHTDSICNRDDSSQLRIMSAGYLQSCTSQDGQQHQATATNKMPIAKMPKHKRNQKLVGTDSQSVSNATKSITQSFLSSAQNNNQGQQDCTTVKSGSSAAHMPSLFGKIGGGPGQLVKNSKKNAATGVSTSKAYYNSTKQSKKGKHPGLNQGSRKKPPSNKQFSNTSASEIVVASAVKDIQHLPAPAEKAATISNIQLHRALTLTSGKKSVGGLSNQSGGGYKKHSQMATTRNLKPVSPALATSRQTTIFPKKVSVDLLGANVTSAVVLEKPRGSTSSLKMLLHPKTQKQRGNTLTPMSYSSTGGPGKSFAGSDPFRKASLNLKSLQSPRTTTSAVAERRSVPISIVIDQVQEGCFQQRQS